MAQTYEIDIKRFNGQDYDTLLPTPAAHAATHQANGSDPITMQTGNYGDNTVTTAKIADGAVSQGVKITLPVASWANKSITVNVAYVTANNNVLVSASPESREAWNDSEVYCTGQAQGTLTFSCSSTPAEDINVNVVVLLK